MMVDTHCHLEKNYYDDVNKIIGRMNGNIIIASGCDMSSNKELIELNYNNVFKCIGIHPEFVDSYTDDDLKYIENNMKKIVAIGEIGLDYHYSKNTKEKQKELFIKQLDLAKKYNKPVIIHSRDAIEDTYNIIKNYNLKFDIHCFSSSYDMAIKFINLGCKIGIGGVITFKNSEKLKEIVKKISLDNILLETDSPYLTPEPYRGKINEPYNVYYVALKIAEIKNISVEQVLDKTSKNALNFFNIDRK